MTGQVTCMAATPDFMGISYQRDWHKCPGRRCSIQHPPGAQVLPTIRKILEEIGVTV